jgi:hypothetical protein
MKKKFKSVNHAIQVIRQFMQDGQDPVDNEMYVAAWRYVIFHKDESLPAAMADAQTMWKMFGMPPSIKPATLLKAMLERETGEEHSLEQAELILVNNPSLYDQAIEMCEQMEQRIKEEAGEPQMVMNWQYREA